MHALARIITAGFALAVLPVVAQVKTDRAPDRFDAADANHDGKVDRAEYDGFVDEMVLLRDTNRDGKLSRDEVGPHAAARFDKIDANHDGSLSFEEIEAFSGTDFATMDANGDGGIDRNEAANAAKADKAAK
jgi:Ca2+-binding EF-hand superfamily protein